MDTRQALKRETDLRERQPPWSLASSLGDLHERMEEMTVRADVVCASHGGRGMHVDIYDPHGPVNHRTAVLVHHGGGWRLGDRKTMGPRCEALAARGFTAVAVEYRSISEAPWPAQLQDVKAAVRWTHDNAADLGIDRSSRKWALKCAVRVSNPGPAD